MITKVCDALCGSGKTSACIKMMNERKDKRFIFATQYLSEVERIKAACPDRNFVSPEEKKNKRTKAKDLSDLIAAGENIATTHSLLVNSEQATKDAIRNGHYVLVLDEAVDIMEQAAVSAYDLKIMKDIGMIRIENGAIVLDEPAGIPRSSAIYQSALKLKSHMIFEAEDGTEHFYAWSIAPDIFASFDEVYVLTYLFMAQPLRSFMEINGFPFEFVGVKRTYGGYEFCDPAEMSRARDLSDLICVLKDDRINGIGKSRCALSYSWYAAREDHSGDEDIERLRKNTQNVIKNVFSSRQSDCLWTTFKGAREAISGKGYAGSFVPYNQRASNEFSDRHNLVYLVNNFPRGWEEKFYREHGSGMHANMYALSFLVQWLFRSAIRNGEAVKIYIPSSRMRGLLRVWIRNLAEGKDLEPISTEQINEEIKNENIKEIKRKKTPKKRGKKPAKTTITERKRKVNESQL